MIIIAGTIDLADPSMRDEVLAASMPLQAAPRIEEPGCEAYCFAADPVVEGRIQVYELWTDEQSLAAHFKHPNYINMGALLRGSGLKGADTRKFRCDHAEPVYDNTMTPRADFFNV